MCIIVASRIGCKQPSLDVLRACFENNPDGAGYMYARDGEVHIHKGFMDWKDFARAVTKENFTKEDSVVYHFRISTQAGVKPEMTHPFPLTPNREACEKLDMICPVGIAHNGIIHMTSDHKQTRFSDTVIFITQFMTKLIRNPEDLTDDAVKIMIDHLTNSKWAIMDGRGEVAIIGQFINKNGILFSNTTFHESYRLPTTFRGKQLSAIHDDDSYYYDF